VEPVFVLPLNTKDAPLATAGGKGANLARLAAAGFPVPPGFLIATAAYRAYVDHNGLDAHIRATTGAIPAGEPVALEGASATIRARFAAGRLPAALADAIHEAYAALGCPPVAVRSSATAEDLPDTSFAGQQDTYLNVVGDEVSDDEALLKAVVNCWSSLWTARAIGYRARHGMAGDAPSPGSGQGLALAVVVQEMVPSEASGVLFTANPITGRRTEMVIESTLGLGEALVSGQVEPDRYVVEAGSGRIQSQTLGAKALSVRSQAGGGTVTQPEEAAEHYALPDAAIGELARLGRQVAEFFGAPQDIEWAWAEDQLYLLQSRPITSLFPLPEGMAPEPLKMLFSFGAVQGMLEPMTPFGQDAIKGVVAGAASLFGYHLNLETQNVLKVAAERLFIDVTSLVRHKVGRRLVHFAATQIEPGAVQALAGLLDDPRLAVTGGLTAGAMRRIVPVVMPVLGRLVLSLLRPDTARRRFQRQVEALAAGFEAHMARATTLSERIAVVEEMLDRAFQFLLPKFIPRFGASMAGLNILAHLAAGLPGGDHDVLLLTRGLPHNVTTEMDLALWGAARRIKADAESASQFDQLQPEVLAAGYLAGRLPRPAQSAIAGFLQQYGMRGVGEIDLGRIRWREDPLPIIHILQGYLHIEEDNQADGYIAPDAAFARGAAAAEAGIRRLAADVSRTRGGWLKARLVHWAARRLRTLAGLRESPKFWAIGIMGIARAALLDSGRELVAAGRLAQPDDLFFLHLAELKALAAGEPRDWPALVRDRREVYVREGRRKQIPRLLLSDGQAFFEGVAVPAVAGEHILHGSPVSPGVAEGAVQVVLNPHGAQLAPGEILVCPGTDPAWTPLFLLAGGLVTEVGGMMTHGSVVAREYGIPAVVGVSQATTRLQTGQWVRVDGTAGQVIPLSKAETHVET
jgi:phosphohistidine swiveling domain-containing protein